MGFQVQFFSIWVSIFMRVFRHFESSGVHFCNGIGILLPKLFWPTVRKFFFTDREKLLKLEAEGQEFAKILRSLEQFVQTVKGQNNFW